MPKTHKGGSMKRKVILEKIQKFETIIEQEDGDIDIDKMADTAWERFNKEKGVNVEYVTKVEKIPE